MSPTRAQVISVEILNLLEEKGRPLNIQELFFYLDAPMDQIYMSLDHLMRSNQILWETNNDQQWIRLDTETAPCLTEVGNE